MRLGATSTLSDNCGYSQQDMSRRQLQKGGHEAQKIPNLRPLPYPGQANIDTHCQ